MFNAPADSGVAAFVGVDTVISGKVAGLENGCVIVEAGGVQLEAVGEVEPGRDVYFCLRPENITLWMGSKLPASSARNQLSGQVRRLKRQGALMRVEVDCCEPNQGGGFLLVAFITRPSALEMGLEDGRRVTLTFKASAVHLIPR